MSSDGWEDDDDMADMFSFGNDDGAPAPPPGGEQPSQEGEAQTDTVNKGKAGKEEEARDRANTDDSFLDLLEEADKGIDLNLMSPSEKAALVMDDKETQDILNWLDEEEGTGDDGLFRLDGADTGISSTEKASAVATPTTDNEDVTGDEGEPQQTSPAPAAEKASVAETEEINANPMSTESVEPAPTVVALPPAPAPLPPTPKPIVFDSLEDALHHNKSTLDQIRSLFVQGGMKVDAEHRPQLWCRTVCSGKTIDQVKESSMADSFVKWRESGETNEDEHAQWIRKESSLLAERIIACDASRTLDEAQRDLVELLLFHRQSSLKGSDEDGSTSDATNDPLLPPVACALLSAGIPTVAASVMMSNIMPSFMPLLALTKDERWEAAKSLHSQFYLLACYHLPLLVFHLDRYAPGWHWPKNLNLRDDESHNETSVTQKSRNLQQHGVVPQSWLISHLAGECGGTLMNPKWLLSLWDLILTSRNNSLRFFLSLAVLEKLSDRLLMLTGSALVDELNRIVEFKEETTLEGFAIEGEEETSESEAVDWVQDWCNRAQTLWEATPRTVVSRLRSAEDEAVRNALSQRQKDAEEKLKARLEAEANAHREAMERKADEARLRLSRARLVAYYRKYNAEKEGNIDKILETYKGRLDVLDRKLKAKYGTGFNPALKPKPPPKTANKLSSIMGNGIAARRSWVDQDFHKEESAEKQDESKEPHGVTVTVSATEVLPIVCWSKEAASKQSVTGLARGRYSEERNAPLKFYLVDSRPEDTVDEQGRFPTAVSLSPESLLDPDRMRAHEEMFESLRGAVHICIMGEGYSAVPLLYGQKPNKSLCQLIAEDESRTSLCSLFFVKKGFPFVSVLEGGFVQAHSWLCREGPNRHLNVSSVLVDYDPESSLFAQMEIAYRQREAFASLPAGEKATRVMQNLFDSSMTSLTRSKYRIDNLASRTETESVTGSVSKFFGKKEESTTVDVEETTVETPPKNDASMPTLDEEEHMVDVEIEPDKSKEQSKRGPLFRNPFAGRRSVVPENAQVDDAAVDFVPAEENLEKPPAPSTTSPFGRFAKAASKKSESEAETAGAQPKENVAAMNRFSGLGSALGKSIKSEANGEAKTNNKSLKNNPFARFGTKENGKSNDDGRKPNRFEGINQLRLNTLSNLRARVAQDEIRTASDAAEVEESISFFENDSPAPDIETEASAGASILSAVSSDSTDNKATKTDESEERNT